MEEKRPGQHPEADRPSEDPAQARAARAGGRAAGGLSPTDEDIALAHEADSGSEATGDALAAGNFGDHKGVDGFPTIDRPDTDRQG